MDKEALGQQLHSQIWECLERLTQPTVDELRPIIEAERAPEAYLLDFEIEVQDFTRGFPINWFVLDREDGLVPDESQPRLLPDVKVTIPAEILDVAKYEAVGIYTWDVAVELLIDWFGQCWRAAGGENCRYPAYIALHDEEVSINLNTMEETEYEDKWPE